MNRKTLDAKRLDPCVAEIYANSVGPTTEVWPQNFETWKKHPVWAYLHDNKPVTCIPLDIYYLSSDTLKNIVTKWCKGLHGYWYYTPKLDFHDPEYKNKTKELHDFRDFEAAVSKDKTLTYAQRAAKIKKEALAHNFIWRSDDQEYIRFNVYLGVAPNSNEEQVKKIHRIYNAIEDAYRRGLFGNTYIGYTEMTEFPYMNKDMLPCTAKLEEIRYYTQNDKLVCEETPGRTHCNLYDENGNYVDYLWNYQDITRVMSAKTFETMYNNVMQFIPGILTEWREDEIVQWMNGNRWIEKEVKECLALFISHLNYIDELNK